MRATVAPASLRAPAKKPSVLSGVARMSEAISGKDRPAYRCAHAGYGCAGGVASASEEALRVERRSPDERSDIRERQPRISLRSCGLRLLVAAEGRFVVANASEEAPVLSGVARMSEATSGKN